MSLNLVELLGSKFSVAENEDGMACLPTWSSLALYFIEDGECAVMTMGIGRLLKISSSSYAWPFQCKGILSQLIAHVV